MVDGPQSGRQIAGRYRLAERLGRGGMAAVYRAVDGQTRATVALKLVLSGEAAQPDAVRERFVREVERTTRFTHPNIVRMLDFGSEPDGALFLVLELLDGETLSRRLGREPRLPAALAVSIGRQLCAALQAVHAAGVIHRDIKPGNVMLLSGAEGTVKLIDFGIARTFAEETHLTGTGLLVGTTEFCSPEQIRGAPIDGRVDLYALGAVLYRALAGVLPFEGPGLATIIHGHLYKTPAPLRARAPDADVPAALEAVILKCLAKDPAARFATAGELGAALQASLRAPAPAPRPAVIAPAALSPRKVPVSGVQDRADLRDRSLISMLAMIARMAPFHEACDEALDRPVAHLVDLVREILQLERKLELEIDAPILRLNGRRVEVASESVETLRWLAGLLASRGLAGLSFAREPLVEDLRRLVAWLGGTGETTEAIQRLGVVRLTFGDAEPASTRSRSQLVRSRTPLVAWCRACALVEEQLAAARRDGPLDTSAAYFLADEFAALALGPRPAFAGLLPDTGSSSHPAITAANVATLSAAVGAELGLAPAALREVAYTALCAVAHVPQFDPLDLARGALGSEQIGVLRQAPYLSARLALREDDTSPIAWRRLVTGFEFSAGLLSKAVRGGVRARLLTCCLLFSALREPRPSRAAPMSGMDALRTLGAWPQPLDPEVLAALGRLVAASQARPLTQADQAGAAAPKGWGSAWLVAGSPLSAPSERLQRELQADDGAAFWSRLAGLLRHLAEAGGETADRLLDRYLPVLDGLLLQEEFGAAADVLAQLRRTEQRGGAEGEVARLVFLLASRLAGDERLLPVGQLLRRRPARVPRDVARFFALLEPSAVPRLVELLDHVEIAENRRAVVDALSLFARRSPQVLLDRLPSARDALAGDLALALHLAGHTAANQQLVAAFRSATSAAAKEHLLSIATQLRTGDARALVVAALDDPIPQVRIAAAQQVAVFGEAAVKALLACVQSEPFAARAVSEREAVLVALVNTGQPEALRYLEVALAAKLGLLGRRKAIDEKLLHVAVLARAGTIATARLLQAVADDARQAPEVSQAARAAAEKLRGRLVRTPRA